MSSDEIVEALEIKEGKKLREITLPQDSNAIDQGTTLTPEQIEIQKLRREIADIKRQRLEEEQQRIHFDPIAQTAYMKRMSAIRDEADQRRYMQLAEADERQKEAQEQEIKERLASNDVYQNFLVKIEKKKQKELRNLEAYFNCPIQEFEASVNEHGHTAEESPASYLIEGEQGKGFRCTLHRYDKLLKDPAYPLPTSLSITVAPVEIHFREHDLEGHKKACIEAINQKYQELIDEKKRHYSRPDKALFRDELKEIEDLPSKTYAT
jgi:hypothetical protein